jgi:hypothetical protein
MFKFIATILLAVFFLSACSEEQMLVNKLDGVWQLASRKVNGVPDTTISNMFISFKKCKISKRDECPGSIQQTIAATGEVQNSDFMYSSTWGDDLDIDFDFNNPYFEDMNSDIIELDKTTLSFEYTDTRASFDRIKLTFRKN